MSAAAQQWLKVERLHRRVRAMPSIGEQTIRRHDDAEQPIDMSAALHADNHSDIRPRDFRHDFGSEIFHQPADIGRAGRLFVHSHSGSPENSPHASRGLLSNRFAESDKPLFQHAHHSFADVKPRVAQSSRSHFETLSTPSVTHHRYCDAVNTNTTATSKTISVSESMGVM